VAKPRDRPLDLWIANQRKILSMAQSKEPVMPLGLYEQLWELHAGFEQVRRALHGLGKHRTFHAKELQRLGAWIEEARAATGSYLAGAIEEAETNEAGRLFRLRVQLERKEE
jgi:hypothetical protein